MYTVSILLKGAKELSPTKKFSQLDDAKAYFLGRLNENLMTGMDKIKAMQIDEQKPFENPKMISIYHGF